MQRSSLQPLFAQLQSRYPTAAIVTELLQVHDGNYVVRALVQVSGTTLITGMAAAPQIESAEDQAMLRSLALLGIQPELAPFPVPAMQPLPTFSTVVGETAPFAQTTITPPTLSSDSETATFSSISPASDSETATFSSISPAVVEEITIPSPPLPTLPEPISKISETDLDLPSTIEPLQPSPTLAAPVTASTSRSKSRNQPKAVTQIAETVAEPALPTSEPVDFSDPIAQIDTEMMRVGWSKEQGRDYLKTTYKKRSRQQLSDDELLDFLSYLQSLPSAVETPF